MTLGSLPRRLALFFLSAFFGLGCSGLSQAVSVNPHGQGEVLIFPYYTTTEGRDFYLNLVNNSDDFKAVKVRLRESMNGASAASFNIYLSPKDHWSALVTQGQDQVAIVRTGDWSCAFPSPHDEPISLSTSGYSEDTVNGPERTREGFIEVIEMGVVSGANWQEAIRQESGLPHDCGALARAWQLGGDWIADPADGISSPSGGLSGYGVFLHVEEGIAGIYNAIALDHFADRDAPVFHTLPESMEPNLGSGDTAYNLVANDRYIVGHASNGIDAVSALFMLESLQNDYILEPAVAAATDWVVTFPTRNYYINDGEARAPFSTIWNSDDALACEPAFLDYFDRENRRPPEPPVQISLPMLSVGRQGLCAQANIVTFQSSQSQRSVFDAPTERNGFVYTLFDGFYNGWGRLSVGEERALVTDSHRFQGLPMVGFAVYRFTNGKIVVDGQPVLSNYLGIAEHKGVMGVTNE